ncbi:MAG: hypothetical protein IPG32_05285 [Saprospirales bacterium]|nr:hypothetical protein [Saprospirales bacterium]
MRDFTVAIYRQLLDGLKGAGFSFQTFSDYLKAPLPKTVLLRHDVDDRKLHSLKFAQIQKEKDIVGTYYFRMVPQSYDEGVIREIRDLGHEIGYHYEEMDFAAGDPKKAIGIFERNLEQLRKLAPITSICMHGSPRSRYDNKDLWKHYRYRDYGIIGEPYFDLDFKSIFYLTDTGRRWDGKAVSVRDKVEGNGGPVFHSTGEIIKGVSGKDFPSRVMINFHPQRWTDDPNLWLREKYTQQAKNMVKYLLIKWKQ